MKLSNIKYNVLVEDSDDVVYKTKLELSQKQYEGVSNKSTKPDTSTKNGTNEALLVKVEALLYKLIKVLELPHQCVSIAYIYIERALKRMTDEKFFLSSQIVQR